MFKNLFKRKTKYQLFWEWFESFEDVMFQNLQENSHHKPMFGILGSHLSEVHPQLDFEFGITPNNIELVITANGIFDVIPEVQKLVEVAPAFQQWSITAFKQRKEGDQSKVKYGNLEIGYDDIYFQYDDADGKLGIQLHIKNFEKTAEFINGTYLLLDALLGEMDVTFKIGFIEWEVLDEENKTDLLPFVKLRALIDARK
uniref:hypothetical protein n=1 Tax=Flavobacterium sp. TaxID=239 RepID=UPI00404A52D7